MRRINAFLDANKRLALAIGLGFFTFGLAIFLLIDGPVQLVGLIFVVIGIVMVPTLKELRSNRQEQEEEEHYY